MMTVGVSPVHVRLYICVKLISLSNLLFICVGNFHWLGYNLIRNSMIFLYCDHKLILSEVFAFRQVIEALSKWNMPELLCLFGLYVLCILSQTTKISKDFIGRSYSMNRFLKLVCGHTK